MLRDQDRIFTNIYGFADGGLEGARSRGDWDDTKGLVARGRDPIVDEVRKSGLRGRGGAGFVTGPEVVVHAQGGRAPGRTTWSSTPTRASPAPARTGRSSATSRTS